jgi:hypothetical protein
MRPTFRAEVDETLRDLLQIPYTWRCHISESFREWLHQSTVLILRILMKNAHLLFEDAPISEIVWYGPGSYSQKIQI